MYSGYPGAGAAAAAQQQQQNPPVGQYYPYGAATPASTAAGATSTGTVAAASGYPAATPGAAGQSTYQDPNANASASPYAGGYGNVYQQPQPQQPQQQQYYQQQPQAQQQQQHHQLYSQQQQPLQQQPPQYQQYSPSAAAAPPPAALNTHDANGLRWTWSTFPNTVKQKGKAEGAVAGFITLPPAVLPMSCMYTPLTPLEDPQQIIVGDDPARGATCSSCGALLNMHCMREEGKFWMCRACLSRNQLPPQYTAQHPAMRFETVEYVLPPQPMHTNDPAQAQALERMRADLQCPALFFLVDTCIPVDELDGLRENLLTCLDWLPPMTLVGLVTYGSHAAVWELGSQAPIARCCTLRGDTEYDSNTLRQMLKIAEGTSADGHYRYLAPLATCSDLLRSLLNDMSVDGATVASSKRPLRATGAAVLAATEVLECLHGGLAAAKAGKGAQPVPTGAPTKSGKLLLFAGGPCTRGPAAVVSTDKSEMMRSHRDIIDGNLPFYSTALNFYNKVAERLLRVNGSLDVFAQSFDQVGVMEMRYAVNITGGSILAGDCFSHSIFANTFERYFEHHGYLVRDEETDTVSARPLNDLRYYRPGDTMSCATAAFNVQMEIHCLTGTRVSSVIGNRLTGDSAVAGLPAVTPDAAAAGKGGKGSANNTHHYAVSSMAAGETIAVLFDTDTLTAPDNTARERFIQFVTRYHTIDGEVRVRVCSVVQPAAPTDAPPSYYVNGECLDQTCAAAVVARMAVSMLERHANKWEEVKRWLDTLLVRFVRRYGTFTPNQPASLQLHPSLALFPSFMFNLRRSEYFVTINISPDETVFKRHWLMREGVDNCILMIQPTLDSYDIENPYATPVLLDSASLRHDNIVLMDAYFNVHIMWGSTIYEWIRAKYQDDPAYEHFAALLQSAEADAQQILLQRYPYPRFSRTDANGSEARHIKTRVNPSHTYQQHQQAQMPGYQHAPGGGDEAALIYTDDTNILQFMETLKRAVVTEK